ncbi:MAG: hypothetical protein JWM44_2275 [Bacilli bacterium]|nr:hypothetical protein [Bacilli bacterium]
MINSIAATDVSEDKTQLQKILDRDEFSAYHHKIFNLRDWIVGGLKYLFKQIAKLIPDRFLPSNVHTLNFISYLVILAGLCLLVYLIYWFMSQLTRQRRLSKRIHLTEEELKRSFTTYMQSARQSEDELNWKDGARYLFLALLFYCDSRGWIRVEGWKTNGEYAEALRMKKPELSGAFREAALLFDKGWYGKKEIDANEFLAMYRLIEPIVRGGEFDVQTQ